MKKTLIIIGSHPNSMKLFDWGRKDCDIWLFNEAPNQKKDDGQPIFPPADAFFQLHHEAVWKNPKNRSDPDHYRFLSSGKTPKVYMQKAYKEVPNSVKYPYEEVMKLTDNIRMIVKGEDKRFKYFSSSPDFALALVAQMWKEGQKYEQVEIYGIELEMESEYQYQRTGFAFWTGYLAALGIKLVLYNAIFDAVVYGYEGDYVIPSTLFEERIAGLIKELGDEKDRYNIEAKNFLDNLSILLKQNAGQETENQLIDLTKKGEIAGGLNGRIKEDLRYLEKAQLMEKEAGAAVFSLGEFEGTRNSYSKQYTQVRNEVASLSAQIDPLLKKVLVLKKGSPKRQQALDEFGSKLAEIMNKNMLLFHVAGAIKENQFYIDSAKFSSKTVGEQR